MEADVRHLSQQCKSVHLRRLKHAALQHTQNEGSMRFAVRSAYGLTCPNGKHDVVACKIRRTYLQLPVLPSNRSLPDPSNAPVKKRKINFKGYVESTFSDSVSGTLLHPDTVASIYPVVFTSRIFLGVLVLEQPFDSRVHEDSPERIHLAIGE